MPRDIDDSDGRERVGSRDRATWAALLRLNKSDRRGESHVSHFVLTEVLAKLCRHATRGIVPQGHAGRGLIDYAIRCTGGRAIWIEVKRAKVPLREEMIGKYLLSAAAVHRIALGVLTNGADWQFWCGGECVETLGVAPFMFKGIRLESPEDVAELRLTLGNTVAFRRLLEGVLEHQPALAGLLQRPRVHATYEREYRNAFTGPPPRLRSVFTPREGRVDPRFAAARIALHRTMTRIVRGELKRVFGTQPTRLAVRKAMDELDLRPWEA